MSEIPLERVAELCREYGVSELSIFGSAARGELRADSDLDFLVLFDSEDYGPWMSRLTGFQEALTELLGRPADVVPKKSLKPLIRDTVLAEAKIIYEAA